MARESLASRLYHGDVSYDFIGRRRVWYAVSGLVLLLSILSLLFRGLHPSVDFKGGDVFQLPEHGHSVADMRSAAQRVGVTPEVVQTTGSGSAARFRIETRALPQTSGNDKVGQLANELARAAGVPASQVDVQSVGATWGGQITNKAVKGLVVFLIAVVIYLSIRYEWKMALAAIAALLHDLIITAGVYSLVGFEVSPSTVIALLTILGYSLYDTVVVFDKVRENTAGIAGGSRMTYSQAANLAVNQTLVRSINTSIIALLPVAGLLIIGAGLLGAGSLKDLALALLIGLAAGAYSSIFIATPLVAEMKEREPIYRQLARRVAARQGKERAGAASAPAATTRGTGTRTATAATPTSTAVLDEADGAGVPDDQAAQTADRPSATAPRPGARPAARGTRGGRPTGRSSKRRRR